VLGVRVVGVLFSFSFSACGCTCRESPLTASPPRLREHGTEAFFANTVSRRAGGAFDVAFELLDGDGVPDDGLSHFNIELGGRPYRIHPLPALARGVAGRAQGVEGQAGGLEEGFRLHFNTVPDSAAVGQGHDAGPGRHGRPA
jgi:hypothetical protein